MLEDYDGRELELSDFGYNMITESYFDDYTSFFINHALATTYKEKYDNLMSFTEIYTDFYGSMFRTRWCKSLDEKIEIIDSCNDDGLLYSIISTALDEKNNIVLRNSVIYLFGEKLTERLGKIVCCGFSSDIISQIQNSYNQLYYMLLYMKLNKKSFQYEKNDRYIITNFLKIYAALECSHEYIRIIGEIEQQKEEFVQKKDASIYKKMKKEFNKIIGHKWVQDMK